MPRARELSQQVPHALGCVTTFPHPSARLKGPPSLQKALPGSSGVVESPAQPPRGCGGPVGCREWPWAMCWGWAELQRRAPEGSFSAIPGAREGHGRHPAAESQEKCKTVL